MMHMSRLVVALVMIGALTYALPISGRQLELPDWAPADFVDGDGDPFPIDNTYWPLVPGTVFHYVAETEDGIETTQLEVTHDTRVVAEVTCVVVVEQTWDEDGLLIEYTEDWYAQDFLGNIWYFGEYSEAYEYDDEGNLIDVSIEGSWEAGVNEAEPGIVMLADPQPGDSYQQEYSEGVAEDMGKVSKLDVFVSVEYGDFAGCLATREWNPLEQGSIEFKYYAPGVGLVLVRELHGKTVRVELVDITGP